MTQHSLLLCLERESVRPFLRPLPDLGCLVPVSRRQKGRQGPRQVGRSDVPFGAKGLGGRAVWKHSFLGGQPHSSLGALTSQVNLLPGPTHKVLHWVSPFSLGSPSSGGRLSPG